MNESVVEARNVARHFGSLRALSGIDLTLDAGESLALVGPNGAGKSTLLRILATLLRPTGGTLRLFGTDPTTATHATRAAIGLLSHQTFLYPDLSPQQNLEFYARLYRIDDAAARIQSLIDRTGLRGWANRPVRTLSRGLEQRCGIARALLHRPRLLLLDEPSTGLDRGAAAVLSEFVAEFRRAGGAVVLSTHDDELAFTLASRLCILRSGRVAWMGSTDATDRAAYHDAIDTAFTQN